MSEDNIYKEIQKAVVDRFGVNCSAEVRIKVFPTQYRNEPEVKVTLFDIQPNGDVKEVNDITISSNGGIHYLPEAIRNVIL